MRPPQSISFLDLFGVYCRRSDDPAVRMTPTHNTFANTHEQLDALRLVGDPEADALVAALYPKGREAIVALNRALTGVVRGGDPLPTGLPTPLRSFLDKGADVGRAAGGWDEDKMRLGARFYRHYCFHIPILLQIATMPMVYAGAKGIEVLTFTGRLEKYAHRRSVETGQMVYDTMAPNGFYPSGKGRRSCQKVRLMHAAVRHMILQSGRWDTARLGVSLNQEDMLATLASFSILIIDSLKILGADFSPKLAEAHHYRWRAVGLLMGIPNAHLAPDLAGAQAQYKLIKKRQIAPSEGGRRLTRAWVEAMKGMVPPRRLHPYIEPSMRLMIGAEAADTIGLVSDPEREAIFEKNRFWLRPPDRLLPHGGLPRRGFDALVYVIFSALYLKDRGPRRPSFGLPMMRRG